MLSAPLNCPAHQKNKTTGGLTAPLGPESSCLCSVFGVSEEGSTAGAQTPVWTCQQFHFWSSGMFEEFQPRSGSLIECIKKTREFKFLFPRLCLLVSLSALSSHLIKLSESVRHPSASHSHNFLSFFSFCSTGSLSYLSPVTKAGRRRAISLPVSSFSSGHVFNPPL